MNIRLGLRIVLAAVTASVVASTASADTWPERQPISMILPAGAGGSSDPLARLLAEELGKRLNQSVVVQNRPGAGGNIGMAQAARARPDGYTMVISWTGPLATNLALYRDVGYDPARDLKPISMVGCTPNVLAVSRTMPAQSLAEFIAYTHAHAGSTSYGTTGVGSSWHIAGEMVSRTASNGLTHIPYTTPSAALTDLLGGRIQAIFPVVPMTVPHVRAGTLQVLAVFSGQRSPVLPDVPTTSELGFPDLVSETCFAILTPTGTPTSVISRLNTTINEIFAAPATRNRIQDMGLTIKSGPPELVTTYLSEEIPRQAALVAASGAKAE